MHWTKAVVVSIALALGGCATQDTILPQTEHTMLEIYRGAMTTQRQDDIEMLQPVDVCQALALEDAEISVRDCEGVVREQTSKLYRQIDAQPAGEVLDYLPYTREVDTEIENLFPRLDNPDILIYVYPHLATRTRAPIPGYSTVIPLYDQVHYRLPGESQRTTPIVLGSTGATITGADKNSPTGKYRRNASSDPERYHKSSDLEGRSLAPDVVPDAAEGEMSGESGAEEAP